MEQGVMLSVHNPCGSVEVVQSHAPRLEALNGRTVGELSNGVWEDRRIFEKIREALGRRLPEVKIVPFTEFPIGSEKIDSESTIDLLLSKGCEAVITGNAA
jgi:hypothetical protein